MFLKKCDPSDCNDAGTEENEDKIDRYLFPEYPNCAAKRKIILLRP